MEYEKNDILVYHQGKTITDQFYIDDDYNVPDVKHDVQRVVLSEGNLWVDDMKRVENYIRVSGKMNFKVLYVTEGAELRLAFLEGRIPFEEMVYTEEEPEENLFIKSMECDVTVSMIHSRKLNVKALAELQISSEGKREESLTLDVFSSEKLYKKYEEKNILRLFTVKKDTYRIKEEISVSGTKESIGTLLWTEATLRKLDTRISEDVLLLQGELLLFCFYESADGKTIQNDSMGDQAFYEFLLAAFRNWISHLAQGSSAYIFHADTEGLNFRRDFKEAGFHISGVCIWVKDSLVMGRDPYQWQHEPVLYG